MSGFLKRCRIWGKTFAPGCRRSKRAGEGGGAFVVLGKPVEFPSRMVEADSSGAWSSLDLLQGLLALPITPPLTYSLEIVLQLVESVPQLHVSSLYHSPMCSKLHVSSCGTSELYYRGSKFSCSLALWAFSPCAKSSDDNILTKNRTFRPACNSLGKHDLRYAFLKASRKSLTHASIILQF